MRQEIIDAGPLVDLWKLPVVAKGVGIPADVHIHPEFFVEVCLAGKQLPDERLSAGHVEIGFNPHAADDLPAALSDALLDFLEEIRIFFFHPRICLRGGDAEFKVRVSAHQVQRAAERIAYNFYGLGPGPEPSHVNV